MTGQEFARLWALRANQYGPALRREMREIGRRAKALSDQLLSQEIYSKPEDRSPTGRPLWRRTNYLAVSETLDFEESDTQAIIDNEAEYAAARHEANKPGRRQINPARTAHWRDDMIGVLAREMPEQIHQLQIRILTRGSG